MTWEVETVPGHGVPMDLMLQAVAVAAGAADIAAVVAVFPLPIGEQRLGGNL